MATREKAIIVAEKLGEKFKFEPWWRGVSIMRDGQDFYVVVRIAHESDALHLPAEEDGVPIRTKRAGMNRAL